MSVVKQQQQAVTAAFNKTEVYVKHVIRKNGQVLSSYKKNTILFRCFKFSTKTWLTHSNFHELLVMSYPLADRLQGRNM